MSSLSWKCFNQLVVSLLNNYMKTKSQKQKKNKESRILKMAKKLFLVTLLGGKCEHCGESKLNLLEFHHINPKDKDFNLVKMMDVQIVLAIKEAKKCMLLCSNCHREEHHDYTKPVKGNRKELKLKMLEYKNKHCCEKCGYDKIPGGLDFHHNNRTTKKFNLSEVYENELTKDVCEELDKCSVLCANCHRDFHTNDGFFEKHYKKILRKSQNLPRYTFLNEEEVINLYVNEKMSVAELSKHFNVNKSTISTITHRNGLGETKENIIVDRKKIMDLHNRGYTTIEISEKLNCNKGTIFAYFKANGIKGNLSHQHPKTRKFNPTKEELEKVLKENSYKDAAKIYNVSLVAVHLRAKLFGINLKQLRGSFYV